MTVTSSAQFPNESRTFCPQIARITSSMDDHNNYMHNPSRFSSMLYSACNQHSHTTPTLPLLSLQINKPSRTKNTQQLPLFSSPSSLYTLPWTSNRIRFASVKSPEPYTMYRVIIDTDPGIDDAYALAFAFSQPQLIIEGITIVHGNHYDLDILATNACRLMELCSTSERVISIPVFKGSGLSLNGTPPGESGVVFHGANGLGNIPLDPPKNTHLINQTKTAEQFIVETCNKYPGEVIVITVGPMTNLAKALLLEPTLSSNLKLVSSMAGVFFTPGNVTPVCEANIHNDPEAAGEVLSAFHSQMPIYMFPLDVTHEVHMDTPFIQQLLSSGPVGKFLHDIFQHYKTANVLSGANPEKIPLHDVCAVIGLLHPELFQGQREIGWGRPVKVVVETKGEWTRGQTVGFWKKWEGKGKENVRVALEVKSEDVKKLFIQGIQSLDEKKRNK